MTERTWIDTETELHRRIMTGPDGWHAGNPALSMEDEYRVELQSRACQAWNKSRWLLDSARAKGQLYGGDIDAARLLQREAARVYEISRDGTGFKVCQEYAACWRGV